MKRCSTDYAWQFVALTLVSSAACTIDLNSYGRSKADAAVDAAPESEPDASEDVAGEGDAGDEDGEDARAALDSGPPADSGGDASSGTRASYATDFDLTESPLSENGVFRHMGADWTLVDSADGVAFGKQALEPRAKDIWYNDSYAYLSGFPANHGASGVVHLASNIDRSCTHEVEILLRWSDSAHDAHGYECNLAYDGSYAQIVRWNGPLGDYTYLAQGSVPGGVHDGDVLSASVVGDEITLSVNGLVRVHATDSTFKTGNPGIAFFRGENGCGSLADYGFTHFAASSVE
jgi:hypothetical protein